MVHSKESDLARAKELGVRIRQEINKRHRILEIDIDGVFKNMLLLRKKKYAALKIVEQPDGTLTSQREVKGLDLVRRDWCPLSKDIGFKVSLQRCKRQDAMQLRGGDERLIRLSLCCVFQVLNEILSGLPREEVVEKIHAHCMALREAIKNNQIPLESFIITKSITKNIKEYKDTANLPHIKVR